MKFFDRVRDEVAREHFVRGSRLYDLGQYEDAVQEFSHSIDLNPDGAARYYYRGLAFARLGDIERAIDDFEKVVALDSSLPTRRDACYNLGKAYGELGQFSKAISWYTEAIDIDPVFAKAYSNRGEVRVRLGGSDSDIEELERAVADLDEAISLDPKDWISYFNRAIAHKALSRREEATDDLKEFLRLAPAGDPQRELAEKMLRGGKQGHASSQSYVSPTLGKRRGAEAQRVMGRVIELNDQKRFEEAIKYCDQVLQDHRWASLGRRQRELFLETVWDEKAFALWNLGLQKGERSLISEALECVNRGIESRPNSERLWNSKGLILAELGRYREAIGAIQKSISFASSISGEDEEAVIERVEDKKATLRRLRSMLGELETSALVEKHLGDQTISYDNHYRSECRAVGGAPCKVTLEQASAIASSVSLVYRWHPELSHQEADKLDSRLRAYIACAVYDAAIKAGLRCTQGPLHGRRPSWIIEDDRVPYGLQAAGFDVSQKLCDLSVGPIALRRGGDDDRYILSELVESFRTYFSEFTV